MQARKEDGRSKKTTKATPQKPTKTKPTAKTSARLEAVKSVKAPVAAKKTNGTNGHETKKKAPAPAKNGSKADKLEIKSETKNAKPAKPAPAVKKAEAKAEPKAAKPPKVDPKAAAAAAAAAAADPGKSEPVKTNSSFARPSPWSAPVLPPVKVDATKLEPRPDEGEFKVGETVVYPARGVADIVAVEDKEIGGRRQSFYVLRVHDTEQKILVPVNNAAQIGLRRPISEAQVREIFRILKVTDVPLDTQTWNRRYRGFVEKLATGSVFAVAEVLRDLSRVKIVKDGLSFSERQMLERARGLIVKEIAVARAKPEDAVRQQIEAIFA
jgi:CarD family transcriptional regulator